MADVLVAIRNVSKIFGKTPNEVVALDNITMEILEGEFLVTVGASGCGKTTLLRILAGLIPPTSGEVDIRQGKLNGGAGGISMVFQSPNLLPWRNVLRNVLLPLELRGIKPNDYRESALSLLKLAGLEGFESRFPFELSGGMQQRVSLVRALITDPSLLLMDEPFGALDALTRERMNLELLRMWSEAKKTVVFVTHSITEAAFLADRIVVMTPRPGRIREIIENDLPRPRTVQTLRHPRFGELAARIRELIGLGLETEGGEKFAE